MEVNQNTEPKIELNFTGEALHEKERRSSAIETAELLASIPRTDITDDLPAILKLIQHKSEYRARTEGGERLLKLLEKHKLVKMRDAGQLIAALVLPLKEKNKMIAKVYLKLAGLLPDVMGPAFAKSGGSSLVPELVKKLAERSPLMRNGVLLVLERYCEALKPHVVLGIAIKFVEKGCTELKMSVFDLLLKYSSRMGTHKSIVGRRVCKIVLS